MCNRQLKTIFNDISTSKLYRVVLGDGTLLYGHIPCPLDVRQIYLLYIGVDIISQVCVDIYNKSADIISVII